MNQGKEGDPAEIRASVEKRYQKDIDFCLAGLKRAIMDEEVHLREEHKKKYYNLDMRYGRSDDFDIRDKLQQYRAQL